jgi:hypothetical protein
VAMVYCMRCDLLIEEELSMGIMKTGFYKTTIPIACECVHCKENEDHDLKETDVDTE